MTIAATEVNSPDSLVRYMEQTTSLQDWDDRCDALKAALGGYPDYWYPTMIMSGEMDRILGKFGGSSEITVHTVTL